MRSLKILISTLWVFTCFSLLGVEALSTGRMLSWEDSRCRKQLPACCRVNLIVVAAPSSAPVGEQVNWLLCSSALTVPIAWC